jgi:hypothetical protein
MISEALSAPFEGWDFGWLAGRSATEPLPWSYSETVGVYARHARTMLDMGTGGGEVLSGLPRGAFTVATEAWPPNAPVAAQLLGPLRIPVVQDEGAPDNTEQSAERGRLPFRNGSFDLVINRHEAFQATEVARVLSTSGVFVTQQVDFHSYDDFFSALGERIPDQRDSWLPLARSQIEDSGLHVARAEAGDEVHRFNDVGAVVYYLRVVAGAATAAELHTTLNVNEHHEALRRLHDRMRTEPLWVHQKRFLMVATRG